MKSKIWVIALMATLLLSGFGSIIYGNTEEGLKSVEAKNPVNEGLGIPPPEEEWNKTFGGSGYDSGNSVQQTSDGGYIITGMTNSSSNHDVWLIKTYYDGSEQWNKTFDRSDYDYGNSVQQTSDGGYIIVGNTGDDIWLIKTDSNGNEEWNKTFGGSDYDYGNSVQQTSDGGYIITGTTWVSVGPDIWLIKTDSNGNEQWTKTFGSFHWEDYGNSVQQTSDGGYIITGARGGGLAYYDIWLIKTYYDGNEEWNKTFDRSDYDFGHSVQQTSDGGYIIAGETKSYDAGNRDVWLINTDSNGDCQWNKIFGGSDYDSGNSVQQTSDGGYIIAGTTNSYGAGEYDVWLIKVKKENWPPIPDFAWIPENPVVNQNITFDASNSYDPDGTIIKYEWDWENDGVYDENYSTPIVNHSFDAEGHHWITLRVTDNGDSSNTCTEKIYVKIPPLLVNFSYLPVNPATSDIINFTAQVTGGKPPYSYYWDFDDENYSDVANASHKYADDGIYNVTLTITDDDGVTNATSKNITVSNVAPIADFTWSSTYLNVHFTDKSTDNDGDVVDWYWEFGDGSTSIQQNPSHVYAHGATYKVFLKVTDDDGETDTVSKDVTVSSPPPPNNPPTILISNPSDGQIVSGTITINGTASDLDGNEDLVKVEIKIDDGSWITATGKTSWSYEWDTTTVENGNHTISSRSYDGEDRSTIKSVTVEVFNNHPPIVNITSPINASEVNGTITITGNASDQDGNETIKKVEITIDDGEWKIANGTTSWNYQWDTTSVKNGNHTIYARAWDGTDYSSIGSIEIEVKNKKEKEGIPGFELLFLIAAIAIVLLWKRKEIR